MPIASEARGLTFGRYVVVGKLGEGGMGVVYAAYDPELDRRVAVKVMRAGPGEGLLREAQAMGRLAHPNVIAVHDVGVADEQVFIALELVDGQTLAEWLAEKPRGWREALPYLIAAGRGLEAAHAAGIIHRDFKPANILLGRDGRARVTDFGLATGGEPVGGNVTPAAPTLGFGTPAYMAPELHRGAPADERSDQFAFAVALHEGVHGARPFAAPDDEDDLPTGLAIGAEILGDRRRPPPRPAPAWLRRVIDRGLSPDPDARYPSLTALLAELDRPSRPWPWIGVAAAAALGVVALGTTRAEPVCAGAPARVARVWSEGRKDKVRAAFAATDRPFADRVFATVTARLDEQARAIATQRTQACVATQAGEQSGEVLDLRMACLDQRLRELDAVAGLFEAADGELVGRATDAVRALGPLTECADARALRQLSPTRADPRIVAQAGDLLARLTVLVSSGRHQAARGLAAETVRLAAAVGESPIAARLLYQKARSEMKGGFSLDGERSMVAAAVAADQARDEMTRFLALNQLAYLAQLLERPAEARRVASLARGVLAHLPPHDGSVIFLLETEAAIAIRERNFAVAEALDRQALLLARLRFTGSDEGELAGILIDLGRILSDSGRPAEAFAPLREAVTILDRVHGHQHPLVATSLNNLGTASVLTGDLESAERYYEEALAIKAPLVGPDSQSMATGLHNLAEVQRRRGRLEQALAGYRRALAIYEARLGPDAELVANPLMGIGQTLVLQGHAAEAIPLLERGLTITSRPNVAPETVAMGQLALARALWDAGRDRPRAMGLAKQAAATYKGLAGFTGEAAEAEAWLASR